MDKTRLLEALAVTLELTNTEMSKGAVTMLLADLERFPIPQVIDALSKIRFDGVRVTLGNIVARLADGRPDPEEAWALLPKDEQCSAPMTDEMAEAYGVVAQLIASGDLIASRMAFKEKYLKLLSKAREKQTPVHWFVSLGNDKLARESVLLDAARLGRIGVDHAVSLLPPERHEAALVALGVKTPALLSAPKQHAAVLAYLKSSIKQAA